nr:Unknown Function [uncultured bacterium]
MTMTWEAFRLTSKSPGELMLTLGPHGVDHLIRQALDTLWREYPEESRNLANVKRRADEVWNRNMRVWQKIKKPAPAAFFADLLPYNADGFVRQGLVLCWMMLPRTGGRKFADVHKIVREIWERNLSAWEADHRTFTAPAAKRTTKRKLRAARSGRGKAKSKKK